ncbi:MAG TPA: hypothetical protein VG075_08670 [Candidatus Acidoferrum sp.]|jgi:opacity protein-like surface antigen|nr:hypothetical protein [Candidatus Acidoferrum sp.]
MRNFVLLALVLGLVSFSAAAQDYPKVELFGGYEFTHLERNVNANGWNTSITGNWTSWLGGKADFSGVYKSGENLYTFMFGPVFALRKARTVTPFANLLVGSYYLSDGRSTSDFTMALGGGLDVRVNQQFALRIIQADWLPLYLGSDWVKKNARVSAGLVLRF